MYKKQDSIYFKEYELETLLSAFDPVLKDETLIRCAGIDESSYGRAIDWFWRVHNSLYVIVMPDIRADFEQEDINFDLEVI